MILGMLLQAIAVILGAVLSLYFWVVIISALLSWVNPDPYNPIVRILRNLTEPVFMRVRRWFPFLVISGLDLTPLVILVAIQVMQSTVVRQLHILALRMQ